MKIGQIIILLWGEAAINERLFSFIIFLNEQWINIHLHGGRQAVATVPTLGKSDSGDWECRVAGDVSRDVQLPLIA